MQEHDRAQHETDTPPAVARFYDTLRRGSLSTAALVHGDADIRQECLLTSKGNSGLRSPRRDHGRDICPGYWERDRGAGVLPGPAAGV